MAAPPTLRSRSSTSTFSLLRPWRSPPLARYAAVVRPLCPPPMTMASYEAPISHPPEARRHYAQKLNTHSTLAPSIWPHGFDEPTMSPLYFGHRPDRAKRRIGARQLAC